MRARGPQRRSRQARAALRSSSGEHSDLRGTTIYMSLSLGDDQLKTFYGVERTITWRRLYTLWSSSITKYWIIHTKNCCSSNMTSCCSSSMTSHFSSSMTKCCRINITSYCSSSITSSWNSCMTKYCSSQGQSQRELLRAQPEPQAILNRIFQLKSL